MCILKKIAEIQRTLMSMEIPKSGYSNFGKFRYHELEDLLPLIDQECHKRNLFVDFDFTENEAILKIINMDNDKEFWATHLPMPEIVAMNSKMNIMQSEGSYVTYLKKYLLVNAFHITEKSMVELVTPEDDNKCSEDTRKQSAPVTDTPKKEDNSEFVTPKCIGKALQRIASKGVPINRKTVYAHVNWRQLSEDEKVAAQDYINMMEA